MSKRNSPLENRVRARREDQGWSQEELARRAGISRTGVGAIEAGQLVPSTSASLALARALGCRVEDLFHLREGDSPWAWSPSLDPCRYWRAEVGGTTRLYPVEPGPMGAVPHDGVFGGEQREERQFFDPSRTLVVACCDPAAGFLAAELSRSTPFRMVVLPRSSRQALDLLRRGLVHAAGVHLAAVRDPGGNRAAVVEATAAPVRLLRVAHWQEGVAVARELQVRSVGKVLRAGLTWVGREPGSGAHEVLREVLLGRPLPRHQARDHRGVVEAIGSGLAGAGVALRLTTEEAGLSFLSVREEAYDLCFMDAMADDSRVRALVDTVRTTRYRALLADLPGYDVTATGEVDRAG